MTQNPGNPHDWKPAHGHGTTSPYVPSRLVVRMQKSERPQTFTKIFRWRLPAGQTREPATVEVAGTFTKWQKVPLIYDVARHTWQVTLHEVTCNRMHRYMLLVDGKPVHDEHCDGLAVPHGPQEKQYQLMTDRGPRVFILFAQAK
jgi:hypothetical protein